MVLSPGLRGEASLTVAEADTATALGSGDVGVLGTPRLLALLEEATVAALAGQLGAAETSVGVSVTLEHLAASGVGTTVTAAARLDSVDGRRLAFDVEAHQAPDDTVVANGRIVRVVVDRDRFLSRQGDG